MSTILVLDDDEEIVEVLVEKIQLTKAKVIGCSHPNEAKKILGERDIDLVISDVTMPEMNGLELMQQANNNPEKRATFIFITGFVESFKDELYKNGAAKVYDKPIHLDELAAWVDGFLYGRSL